MYAKAVERQDAAGSAVVKGPAYKVISEQVEALFAHGKPWLVSELEESTAADFLLIARLRRMRDDGHSLRTYPLLLAYSDRNPAFAENYYESAPTSCLVS